MGHAARGAEGIRLPARRFPGSFSTEAIYRQIGGGRTTIPAAKDAPPTPSPPLVYQPCLVGRQALSPSLIYLDLFPLLSLDMTNRANGLLLESWEGNPPKRDGTCSRSKLPPFCST